jgi:hypothetical protein
MFFFENYETEKITKPTKSEQTKDSGLLFNFNKRLKKSAKICVICGTVNKMDNYLPT